MHRRAWRRRRHSVALVRSEAPRLFPSQFDRTRFIVLILWVSSPSPVADPARGEGGIKNCLPTGTHCDFSPAKHQGDTPYPRLSSPRRETSPSPFPCASEHHHGGRREGVPTPGGGGEQARSAMPPPDRTPARTDRLLAGRTRPGAPATGCCRRPLDWNRTSPGRSPKEHPSVSLGDCCRLCCCSGRRFLHPRDSPLTPALRVWRKPGRRF